MPVRRPPRVVLEHDDVRIGYTPGPQATRIAAIISAHRPIPVYPIEPEFEGLETVSLWVDGHRVSAHSWNPLIERNEMWETDSAFRLVASIDAIGTYAPQGRRHLYEPLQAPPSWSEEIDPVTGGVQATGVTEAVSDRVEGQSDAL